MQTICPYPGLRPFNEEESIFFKGREQQVERLVRRIEEKKFLMVNGASGDGKSSLIYAGVIPFAKAGFFKAKYNNWIVADFRPERTPLKNLTKSLTKHLKLDDLEKTEKELGYGFSALCDLYKNSNYYIDESKNAWIDADETQRKGLKRKAANLLILVDQFEEFFTNPENYLNGIPSLESQKTVNLLLETYKLAKEQDLPIYVVCTMRSDYIGQCAAFRGLPEAIGYSQFFVPRLKRQEIEQVIEGPAALAGCKISKRLTQTLLNSLTDGFDQLPILQHALNHIWKTANDGADEMDLIHLAKVGGLSPKMLAAEDRKQFETWFNNLPEYKKELLEKPSLSNILNAHARELFLSTHLIYKEKFGKEIKEEEAQKIIKAVFQCLTKIDASRAVRNRMTLQEITDIINDENITAKKVDQLLFVYREQGNTFLQPFVEADEKYLPLDSTQVLDITHESLIRNWTQLTDWANEEYENLQNYLDFSKQLQRWVNSNYNSGYLLPIGPLTYFETWYDNLKPSKYWINRYEEFDDYENDNLSKASEKLNETKRFIEKSAKKLFVTKTVLKYGANKIIGVFAFLVMMIAITYYYFDYREKQNGYVINTIIEDGIDLLKNNEIHASSKAKFLIANDRLRACKNLPYIFDSLIELTQNNTEAISITSAMIEELNKMSNGDSLLYNRDGKYASLVLNCTSKLFSKHVHEKLMKLKKNKAEDIDVDICTRVLSSAICMSNNFASNKDVEQKCAFIASNFRGLMFESLKFGQYEKLGISNENLLTSFLGLIALDEGYDSEKLLELISPYEAGATKKNEFRALFDKKGDIFINCNKIPQGGYYEFLAMLYAAEYKTQVHSIECLKSLIDSTKKINQIYVPTNIIDVIFKNWKNPIEAVDLVNKQADFYKLRDSSLYWSLKCKSLFNNLNKNGKLFLPQHSKIGYFILPNSIEKIWQKSESILKLNTSVDGKLELANFYKLWGFYLLKQGAKISVVNNYFQKSLAVFESISFKDRELEFENISNKIDIWSSKTFNYLWFFPMDHYEFSTSECSWNSYSGWHGFVNPNSNSAFLNYILENKKESLYKSNYGFEALEDFGNPNNGHISKQINYLLNFNVESNNTLIGKNLIAHKYISNLLEDQNNGKRVKNKKINLSKIPKNAEIDDQYLINISAKLIESGDIKTSEKVMNLASKGAVTQAYLKLCLTFDYKNYSEYTFYLLQKLIEAKKAEKSIYTPDFFRLLGRIGGNKIEMQYAKREIREYPGFFKSFAIDAYILGLAENGKYFTALNTIPDYYSDAKHLENYSTIVMTEVLKLSNKNDKNAYLGIWNDGSFFEYATDLESDIKTKIGGNPK